MARPGRKKRTALFIVEIICLLLFIGGLYVYGQIDSRLNKIETPQLDESKIVTNVTAPQMSGYTTYAPVSYTHLLQISDNTNAAIGIATGNYIAFADHDDTLAEEAFYQMAKEISQHPDCLLYTSRCV